MNRAELEKRLAKLGAVLLRHGGSHDVWEAKSGARLYIPRHRDVDEVLAKSIIKQAGK